jgi:hypothetical protein
VAFAIEKSTFTCAIPASTPASHSHGVGTYGSEAPPEGSVRLLQQLPWESGASSAEGIDSARQTHTGLAKIKANPATNTACQHAFTGRNLAGAPRKVKLVIVKNTNISVIISI